MGRQLNLCLLLLLPPTPATTPFGPPEPQEEQSAYGPEAPAQAKPIVLVLGPGRARGFAYAGVIKALKQLNIPIGAVVGSEIGSLMGALFALSQNQNQLDWWLARLKEESLKIDQSFFAKFSSDSTPGKKLEQQLRQFFGKKELKDSKIPFWIGIAEVGTNRAFLVNQGKCDRRNPRFDGNTGIFYSSAIESTWGSDPSGFTRQNTPLLCE